MGAGTRLEATKGGDMEGGTEEATAVDTAVGGVAEGVSVESPPLTQDDRGRRNAQPARQAPETTAVRMRKMVLKYADDEDFDPVEDPPRLAKVLRRGWKEGSQGVFAGFLYA